MAWVRIHDAALTHPKIVGFFDPRRPFDLWVWGLSYSQAHLTDGVLPAEALPRGCGKAATRLVLRGLWDALETGGYRIHDFLDWNDSRETIRAKREGARNRLQSYREKRVSSLTSETLLARSGVVSSSSGSSEKGSGEKPSADLSERAGRLREELYPAWYAKYRNGARLRLIASNLEYQDALTLVQTWDDATLEKLARIVLTTDDPFISGTDRGFRIFALKASWADNRLKQAESGAA